MGCHALLRGILPTQGSNPHLGASPAFWRNSYHGAAGEGRFDGIFGHFLENVEVSILFKISGHLSQKDKDRFCSPVGGVSVALRVQLKWFKLVIAPLQHPGEVEGEAAWCLLPLRVAARVLLLM